MLRENIKWKNHKIESTKVVNRGRLNRSSEEVSVMEMSEGLGVISLRNKSTLKGGGTYGRNETL